VDFARDALRLVDFLLIGGIDVPALAGVRG